MKKHLIGLLLGLLTIAIYTQFGNGKLNEPDNGFQDVDCLYVRAGNFRLDPERDRESEWNYFRVQGELSLNLEVCKLCANKYPFLKNKFHALRVFLNEKLKLRHKKVYAILDDFLLKKKAAYKKFREQKRDGLIEEGKRFSFAQLYETEEAKNSKPMLLGITRNGF